jgi:hypothetical protein
VWSCHIGLVLASADPVGISGAGMVLQSCPELLELAESDFLLSSVIAQSLDVVGSPGWGEN